MCYFPGETVSRKSKITAPRTGTKPAIDPRYSGFRLRVARSRIHGYGVYAEETIPAGRRVIEYTGERISRVECRRRFLRAWRSRGKRLYLAWLDPYWTLDGAVGGSGAELMNHCCEPNLYEKRIRGRLYLISRRRIRTGEELTTDYRFPKDGPRIPCRCGASTCRGTVNLP